MGKESWWAGLPAEVWWALEGEKKGYVGTGA